MAQICTDATDYDSMEALQESKPGIPGEVRSITRTKPAKDKGVGDETSGITTRRPSKRPTVTPGMIPGEGLNRYL